MICSMYGRPLFVRMVRATAFHAIKCMYACAVRAATPTAMTAINYLAHPVPLTWISILVMLMLMRCPSHAADDLSHYFIIYEWFSVFWLLKSRPQFLISLKSSITQHSADEISVVLGYRKVISDGIFSRICRIVGWHGALRWQTDEIEEIQYSLYIVHGIGMGTIYYISRPFAFALVVIYFIYRTHNYILVVLEFHERSREFLFKYLYGKGKQK